MVYMFSSTSKITYPGSGVAMLAASVANIEHMKKQMSVQTIGPDKLNQLRHVRMFKNKEGLLAQAQALAFHRGGYHFKGLARAYLMG